ncbi:hypothetical protein MCUN1_001170 [Malassezia cuniculi]|uniref:Actin-related protein 10 n=1 Tax=Malassezia cuniculi TaxID=948313 RepID=A0AAF0ETY6_9BASI|nr:hypothetical protein MCUN1_001170 [Malassezia cuniculi]
MRATASPRARARAPLPDTRVVLDVGSRVIKAGICGEPSPRVVVDAADAASAILGRRVDSLWELDMMHVSASADAKQKFVELVRVLNRILRGIWQDHLLVDPPAARVLCVHSPLLIDTVQDAICEVVLHRLEAAAVSFIDSHTLALVAAGRSTGLVVDVGYLETCVMPVYGGRPIERAMRTTPRGGRRLVQCLRTLLAAQGDGAAVDMTLANSLASMALLVGPPVESGERSAAPFDPDAFARRYSTSSVADMHYGDGDRVVPGWIRERAAEVLFEPGDEDEASIVECVVQSLKDIPMDARREILESVVLAGGTATIPGFARRVQQDLERALHAWQVGRGISSRTGSPFSGSNAFSYVHVLNAPRSDDAPLPMASLPSSLLAWIGGSIAGSLGSDGTLQITREQWLAAARVP